MPNKNYQFQAPPVDSGNNRVNTSRQTFANTKSRGSFRYANILQPGQTMPIPCNGTQFYFRTCTATIQARPLPGGVFSDYSVGEGMNLNDENAFAMIEVKNNNSFVIVFELFVGFQGFIDNKLILSQALYPQVAYPTYPTPNAAANVNINDISGTKFADINGVNYYALYRVAIVISNTDTGVTLLLQKAGSVVANGPAVMSIFPATSIRIDMSGNYCLNLGGANINAIVSEIYSALAA